jgi:ankyrin repeat protein
VALAAGISNSAAVQVLLQHGADPYVQDYTTRDAVFYAAADGSIEVLELMMRHNPARFNSSAPLVAAAAHGHLTCTEWLLSTGTQINAVDARGWTALHAAVTADSSERMCELLLKHGADVHACMRDGTTPLHVLASSTGSVPCAKLLLAAGADAACSDLADIGALHVALRVGYTELVQLLLQHGADALLNTRCPRPCQCCRDATPVTACNHTSILKLLLAAGGDVHIRSSTGNTCLHIAAHHEHPVPLVCALIKAGADISAASDKGDTAADVARHKGNELLAALLDRAAAQQT